MTRLQQDATKELIISLAALIAVGSIYALTRNAIISSAGLSVFGLSGLLRPSAGEGPVMTTDDMATSKRRVWIPLAVLASLIAILQAVFLMCFRKGTALTVVVWSPALVGAVVALLIVARMRSPRLTPKGLPKYDEREREVLRTAQLAALWAFWLAFVVWGTAAGMLSANGRWHLPGATYALQVFVGLWLVRTVHCLAVFWQERRAAL